MISVSGELDRILKTIFELPTDFHEAGSMSETVLRALTYHAAKIDIQASAETGCGKSTLAMSWLSQHHTVFTLSHYGELPCQSFDIVKSSPLLKPGTVSFVTGPSQVTLPKFEFRMPLQLVLIDGPHGFPFPQLEYYYFYPHIEPGGLLIIDDIHIPTIRWLYQFLIEDEMFELLETVEHTAFFQRTLRPTFNPFGDDWWLQCYNANRLSAAGSDANRKPAVFGIASKVRALTRHMFGRFMF